MTKISIKPDCGNAPRKLFLRDLSIAFAKGDIGFLSDKIPETIKWTLAGEKEIQGRAQYLSELKGQKFWNVKELMVDTIITHGPDASVSGQLTASDDKVYLFCDVYRFKGAGGTVINSITTFIIEKH